MLILIVKVALALLLGSLPSVMLWHPAITHLFNGLKGWLAAGLLPGLALPLLGVGESVWLAYLCGVFVLLGQLYSPFSATKGSSIATAAGVIMAVEPWALSMLLPVWVLTLFLSGYLSLANMLAAVSLPIYMLITGTPADSPPMGFAMLMLGLMIHQHKPHLERLRAGQETKEDLFKWRQ